MARIRTIKPGFFKNEELAELQGMVRLFYIGLWTQADRAGRLEDRPKRLKAEIFPYDNINIEEFLSRLQSAGFISRYKVGEMKLIQINKFLKHQCPNIREPKSELPEQHSTSTIPEHLRIVGREGKGEGKESPPKLISEFKISDCNFKKGTVDFEVMESSSKLFEGFKKAFPLNKDLDLIELIDWVPYVRILIAEKNYTYEQVAEVLNWAITEKFWKKVIINVETLEKNFEKIKIQYHGQTV